MKKNILNIVLGFVLVAMMSACGTDDVVEKATDYAADIAGADVSDSTYDADDATAYLDGEYVAIVKYVSSLKVDLVALYAKQDYDIDRIIKVSADFGCASLGLTQDNSTQYDGGTLYEYSGGGKTCYEFDYSTADSSNKGTAHVAYSSNDDLH